MQPRRVIEGSFVYTRISKAAARKLWGQQPVVFCPVNLRPGEPRLFHSVFCAEEVRAKAINFDEIIKEFVYYNCCNETGNYLAFYIVEKVNGCDLAC